MSQGSVDSRRGEESQIKIVRGYRAGRYSRTLHIRRVATLGLAAEAMISAFYIKFLCCVKYVSIKVVSQGFTTRSYRALLCIVVHVNQDSERYDRCGLL